MKPKVLGIVMAGGEGKRLFPLTRDRAKPAVPFGGQYRIVDFVLSNFINSEIYSIYVLVQFKCQSLIEHLQERWQLGNFFGAHYFISAVPAQMWRGQEWYRGTADAVYQNLHLIGNFAPDLVAIFGADHIYRMDLRQMIEFHQTNGAEVTIAAFPVPLQEASSFGILQTNLDGRITGFQEKPALPIASPSDPTHCLASMGNYIFSTSLLTELLEQHAKGKEGSVDFGYDIIPPLIHERRVYAYDFRSNHIPGDPEGQPPYWRDVGTLDAYHAANMDLRGSVPTLNLYNHAWPIRTASSPLPPAKFTNDEGQEGRAIQSVIADGCIINGGIVADSVLGRGVFIHTGSRVEDSVILDGCRILRHARVRRAILDKNVIVPEKEEIGWNLEKDRQRFTVTESGLTVVPKGYRF
jgi:glucose-1-phosphate adenylyltransferase